MRSWRPGRAIGLWAADVTAAVREWRRFWWRRMRSWRPGRAIGLWAADVRSGLMQVRPRTLGLATGTILLCSMALAGLLTMGGGSVPRALGGAFTVEVDESGQPYVALDPQALGDGGSTKAGGRAPAVPLFAVAAGADVFSFVPVGDPQPPPGPSPGPDPSPAPSPGPSPSPTPTSPPPTTTEPPPTTTEPPPTTTEPPPTTTEPPPTTTEPPPTTTEPPGPT
jgi:hypothetical protein